MENELVLQTEVEDRKRAEALLAGEKRLLEMIARGQPLTETLTELCLLVEHSCTDCVCCSILLLDPETRKLWHAASPSIPKAYTESIDGFAIGPEVSSCGTAAYRGKQVIASDIATDPRWAIFRDLALGNGLRACWSTPIFSHQSDVMGTFAMFSGKPSNPTAEDQEVIAQVTHLASIAIERERSQMSLTRALAELTKSESRLRTIIDAIPGFVWSAAPDGSVDFLNQRWCDYTGINFQDASGAGWQASIHPDDAGRLLEYWQRLLESGEPGEIEARLRRFDGEFRWFLIQTLPLRDESGHLMKWYGQNTDIEDRKRAEEKQRESDFNLRQMTETIPEMLWSATPEGAIDYCNARVLDYTGFPAEAVMGSGWTKLLHPDDVDQAAREWMSCVATGAPYRVEVRTLHAADHRYRWCVTTALPLLDQQGRILKWHGTIVDMHDWKQAQEELRNTQAELAHMMRLMTMAELTASIAHEVNQPLSGIITNASTCLRMLASDPPNVDGARETARRTIRDGNRASDVITKLRALFGKKDAVSESVDLNEATREVIALSLGDLQRNHVVLRTELAHDLPPVIGDRVQLQQVVLNLLRNASDAMIGVDDHPRQLMIQTAREQDDSVRLNVQDTGVGIDPNNLEGLFNSFYTTKSAGMGIGLSISRSIIENHHGRLWAAPNDGPGATFSFSVPCERAGLKGATSLGGRQTPDTMNRRQVMRNL